MGMPSTQLLEKKTVKAFLQKTSYRKNIKYL